MGLARSAATPPASPLSFEAAVRWAVAHNPDLLALRAQAAAVNVNVAPEPIGVEGGRDDMKDFEGMLEVDALSLLGLGVRRGEIAAARARRSEAFLAHHARAREVAAEIAEAFAVEAALAGLALPDVPLPAEAYVKAGLAPGAAQTAEDATRVEREAEAADRESARAANRYALLRSLGSRPDAALAFEVPPAPWPPAPEVSTERVVLARASVQRLLAAYETADAEFRRAVAAQFPTIVLKPAVGGDPLTLFGAVALRLPIGADAEARAKASARDAARLEAQGGILDALAEAATAREEAAAAARRLASAGARAKANEEVFSASKARLEAEAGGFFEAVFAAESVVSASRELRMAAVEEARARVRAAAAAGWPGPEVVR